MLEIIQKVSQGGYPHPMPATTLNASQNVLTITYNANETTKCILTYIEKNPSHASEDKKSITTFVN
jgi:hypothetical protein